tara:strand:+ start:12590 stop:13018 length:429 start_codon:yes stop_codon:yes gene_type:complete
MTTYTRVLPEIAGWEIIPQKEPIGVPEALCFLPASDGYHSRTPHAVVNGFQTATRFSNLGEAEHFWKNRDLSSDHAGQFILFPGVPVRCTGHIPEACVSGDKGFLAMIYGEDRCWSVKAIPSMDDLSEHARGATIRIAVLQQ